MQHRRAKVTIDSLQEVIYKDRLVPK